MPHFEDENDTWFDLHMRQSRAREYLADKEEERWVRKQRREEVVWYLFMASMLVVAVLIASAFN